MTIFLDANVLISVLNHEYPVFLSSSRVLSLADRPGFRLYTSPLCFAIAFYFCEKKSGPVTARRKMSLLAEKLYFTEINPHMVHQTLQNKKILDLEDGLQYYSALGSGCDCILTEDRDGFYYSEIQVMNCRDFLTQAVG